jgi:hypothetical protein
MKKTKSFSKCLNQLRKKYQNGLDSSSPYDKLSRSTLYSWFDKKTFQLSAKGRAYFENQSSRQYERNLSILSKPELLEELKTLVLRQRSNGYLPTYFFFQSLFFITYFSIFDSFCFIVLIGIAITAPLLQGLFTGIINQMNPGVLKDGKSVSLTWTRNFLKEHCNMSFKRVNGKTFKLPKNWERQR